MAFDSRSKSRPRSRFASGAVSLLLIGCLFTSPIFAAASNTADDVLHFLDHNIEWFRRLGELNQTQVNPEEVVFRDAVRKNSTQSLRLAFDFGIAQAKALAATDAASTRPAAGSRTANLAQAVVTARQQVLQIQAELDAIAQDIPRAPATSRPTLLARREKLQAQLELIRARQNALNDLIGFMSTNQGDGGLLDKVLDLQRSIPEAGAGQKLSTADTQPSAPSAAQTAAGQSTAGQIAAQFAPSLVPQIPSPAEAFRPGAVGIVGLIEQMFSLTREMSDLHGAMDDTQKLSQENQKLRDPLRAELVDAIHRGDALAAQRDTDDPQALAAQRQELQNLTIRFNLLAAAVVPLGEQNMIYDATRTNLADWHSVVQREYTSTLRYLLFRLIGMAVAVFILVGISEIWKRATFRYVHDVRRRRQFLLLRRIVVGCFILITIIGGFVTEIGSLATFAGLLTAGIAVSLQTVILSGVAYFFLIGRYGVRVGDRVTISGITGDVVDVGLFRLYLMELGGTPPDLHRTGRIVVFSNSVLFGGSAFFKQMPGADYTWHQVAMTLAPDSDIQLAEKLFMDAVNSVYGDYRAAVEQQHAAVNQLMHLQLPAPVPHGRLKFTEAGLEIAIRYPVLLHSAPETDDRITRKLLDMIAKEPKLKLVPSGTPRIQAAA